MKNIYFAKIQVEKSGMTNQLISLISNIILALEENKKVIIVDKFLNDYSKESYSNVSNILNLNQINQHLKEKYNMILLDRYHINFKPISFLFGSNDTKIDITNEIMEQCYTDDKLFIPSTLNLNALRYDPCPNHEKKLFVKYFLNDIIYEEEYNEKFNCVSEDIVFDLHNDNMYLHRLHWINYLNRQIFDDVLKHISFNNYFVNISDEFIRENSINDKINVMHLRLEDDALEYWGKINNMSTDDYKTYLENKYINLIINHINKGDETIILSYYSNNRVVEYLKTNNFKYHFVTKKKWYGREQNAIIDLLVAEHCNNVFIGNFHINKLNGSTFSYFILQKLDNNVKKIMLDLDIIRNEPSIGYSSV
jgi:hypothetical protein